MHLVTSRENLDDDVIPDFTNFYIETLLIGYFLYKRNQAPSCLHFDNIN